MAMTDTEDMSLAEHDLRYHNNNYRGGRCLFRERIGMGDDSDRALADANAQEANASLSLHLEERLVEKRLREMFPTFNAKNSRMQLLEADKDGNNRLMVWCGMDTPDEALGEAELRGMMNDLGYDTVNYSIMEEKPQGESKNRAKPKKLFVSDVKRVGVERSEYADAETSKRKDRPSFLRMATEGEMDDEKKSRLLKQYGIKSEGGVIRKRTGDDDVKDRIRKYLGIKNDFGSSK